MNQAQDSGLEDGTRVEHREHGWVVADQSNGYLADVDHGEWVVGDDDEEMPPLYFDTPEDAYRAYALSEWLAEQRAKRREEALRRLGKW